MWRFAFVPTPGTADEALTRAASFTEGGSSRHVLLPASVVATLVIVDVTSRRGSPGPAGAGMVIGWRSGLMALLKGFNEAAFEAEAAARTTSPRECGQEAKSQLDLQPEA